MSPPAAPSAANIPVTALTATSTSAVRPPSSVAWSRSSRCRCCLCCADTRSSSRFSFAAAASGDRDALIAADEAFHRSLIQLSKHQLLAQFWNGLYLRIHQIMSLRVDEDVDLVLIHLAAAGLLVGERDDGAEEILRAEANAN